MQITIFTVVTTLIASINIVGAIDVEPDRQVSDKIPQNYTLDRGFQLEFNAKNIIFSPDQNWILYLNDTTYSLTFYYRSRTQWQDFQSSVSLNSQADKDYRIVSWSFNQKGDLLFIGTNEGLIYKCKFSAKMSSEDCGTKFNPTPKEYQTSVSNIKVNSKGQIACTKNRNVLVLSLTEEGEFVEQLSYNFPIPIVPSYFKWHPKDEDIIILGLYNDYTNPPNTNNSMLIFNITTSNFSVINGAYISSTGVMPDGNIVLASFDNMFNAYTYEQGNVTFLQTVLTDRVRGMDISADGKFLIAGLNTMVVIYFVNRTYSAESLGLEAESQLRADPTFNLTKLCSIPYRDYYVYGIAVSSDGNQILIPDLEAIAIKRYKLCRNDTYLFNMTCLKCSSNCSTCHIKPDLCLTCPISYTLENGSCLACESKINACLTCSNASFCLTCNTSKLFNSSAVNGTCFCQPSSYQINNSCIECGVGHICLDCESSNECKQCNKELRWKQTPVNGSCVCEDFYFNSSNTCKPCDNYGACKQCVADSVCNKCDYAKGYQETPSSTNSTCICRSSYSFVNNKCILCSVSGCLKCTEPNKCSQCSSDQGYNPEPDNSGNCNPSIPNPTPTSNFTMILIIAMFVGAFIITAGILVYCKWKKKKKEDSRVSLMREEEEPNDSFAYRPSFMAHVIKDTGPEYSDEERMRLERLMKQSLLSAE